MEKRVYDVAFKQMSVVLADVKGSVKAGAEELDIDPGRINKWENQYKNGGMRTISTSNLNDEQKRDQKGAKRTEGGKAGA